MSEALWKSVGAQWTWLAEYVYLSSRWTINAEPGRTLEVGMGVRVFGQPRGQKKRFTSIVHFTTVGLGSIHVRVTDEGGPCLVRLDQGKVGLITVHHWDEVKRVQP